jgi:hypothetical protein
LRQMNDNDILLKREDSLKAWYLLQENGFTHELIKSPLHKKILPDIGKHLPTLYKNGYAIEIHHKLFDPLSSGGLTNTDPVDNAVEIFISGTKAFILPGELQQMHLLKHFEKHSSEGKNQLRLYADIILLDQTSTLEFPDIFINNLHLKNRSEYQKAAYRNNIKAVPAKNRLRYITGDIFPSVKWMKQRYKCNALSTLFYYPIRVGKLFWLI